MRIEMTPPRGVHLISSERLFRKVLEGKATVKELEDSLPENVILVTCFPKLKMVVYHFAAYIGKGRVIEFSKRRGCYTGTLQKIVDYSYTDSKRCKKSTFVWVFVDYYSHTCFYNPSKSLRGVLFPTDLHTVRERSEWALETLQPRHYNVLHLNCEHITRYILTGCVWSEQERICKARMTVSLVTVTLLVVAVAPLCRNHRRTPRTLMYGFPGLFSL